MSKIHLLLLCLVLVGCSTQNEIAGISCKHGDTVCGFNRNNTLRAQNGHEPVTWERWTGTDRSDSTTWSSSTTTGQPSSYVIRRSPTQVWLQDEKLNNMINPQGEVFVVLPVR